MNDFCFAIFTFLSFQKLYLEGARIFWIHNTAPIGCFPAFVISSPPKPDNADPTGCLKSYNEVAQEFNKQLKDRVTQLRAELLGARLIYVDIYSAKYSLISEANKYGRFYTVIDLYTFVTFSFSISEVPLWVSLGAVVMLLHL